MTHICVSKLTITGSDNGLLPGGRQAIIWTNAGILLIRNLRNKLQWNLKQNSCIFIQENAFENVVCEMASILFRPQCVNLWDFMRYMDTVQEHYQFIVLSKEMNIIRGYPAKRALSVGPFGRIPSICVSELVSSQFVYSSRSLLALLQTLLSWDLIHNGHLFFQ